MLEDWRGLGWGATAVGLFQYWTISNFWTIDSSRQVLARTRVLFGQYMYFFLFHPFIVCMRKEPINVGVLAGSWLGWYGGRFTAQ